MEEIKYYTLAEAKELMKVHGAIMRRSDYGSPHQLIWNPERDRFDYCYGDKFEIREKASDVFGNPDRIYVTVKMKLKGMKPWTD